MVEDKCSEWGAMTGTKPRDISIESGRAFDVFYYCRNRVFCKTCEPLLIPEQNEFQLCRCDLFNRFVGGRWLCIPCFFAEEAKTFSERTKHVEAVCQYRSNSLKFTFANTFGCSSATVENRH